MVAMKALLVGCLLVFACLLREANSHGAVVWPKPRNSLEGNIEPWSGAVPDPVPAVSNPNEGYWCPTGQLETGGLSGENGQACYWFSNGCSIGCPKCDGKTRGPSIHTDKMDTCGLNFTATVCDPSKRTVNTGAKCGSPEDKYYFSPWRAPGSSPVFDACGIAGGTNTWGHHGAQYRKTEKAKQGDFGSSLPNLPSGTVWKSGTEVNVSWAITANHGGGYQYRLCPSSSELTEECFQKIPLPFTGLQSFLWADGTQVFFPGTYVTEGTVPKGSAWAMNPIPRNDTSNSGQSFPPRCEEVPDCGSTLVNSKCLCSGMWGPYGLQIIDTLQVPHLPPGDYVLGWRWDCEESTQVWSSCSDITIAA